MSAFPRHYYCLHCSFPASYQLAPPRSFLLQPPPFLSLSLFFALVIETTTVWSIRHRSEHCLPPTSVIFQPHIRNGISTVAMSAFSISFCSFLPQPPRSIVPSASCQLPQFLSFIALVVDPHHITRACLFALIFGASGRCFCQCLLFFAFVYTIPRRGGKKGVHSSHAFLLCARSISLLLRMATLNGNWSVQKG